MRYRIDKDPFDKIQPEKEFVKELMLSVHREIPKNWNTRMPKSGEAYLNGVKLNFVFPDDNGLLETIYNDFKNFIKVMKIGYGQYEIVTEYAQTECYEEYKISISENKCVISASDTEGIRRGLIYIEDEMKRHGGPFLPLGEITRKPFVKSRISRCFFSPHYCPGSEGELIDDIDYYPDEYLNRLMHEGINGLWIQERFRNLLESDIVTQFGKTSKQRIKKLNEVI